MANTDIASEKLPVQVSNGVSSPAPPPLPNLVAASCRQKRLMMNNSKLRGYCCVSSAATKLWDELFDSGYRADVRIHTDDGGVIFAHANILSMASPVLRGMIRKSNGRVRKETLISIRGVPYDAVRVFIRFLYSSRYEEKEMQESLMNLLVLSHVYVVPQLKRLCEQWLEEGLLTLENLIDVFQISLLCDAPRLSLICHRMMLRNLKAVSSTEGWIVMKHSHPALEKELLDSIIYEEYEQKERIRKSNERKIYLLLYEAMEALVHICRDGCRTIGPYDKDFDENQAPCNYTACKGIESLVRHFAGCKQRVTGGCVRCKRMWQLLELHSRLCSEYDSCKVPLCRKFKKKIRKQSKKDQRKWRILVNKMSRTKRIGGGPFSLSVNYSS